MTKISIIVATDENNAIGRNNGLLCHLPNDLKYFKRVTEGHPVIMGRKTFESLPKGALPNRRNIVITANKALRFDNCEMAASLEEAISLIKDESEAFIIGGGSVYKQALPLADKLYITRIHHGFAGVDTFFPEINPPEWEVISSEENPADEKNKYAHTFIVLQRI